MERDLLFDFGDFSDTEIKVEAATDKGKAFLASMFGAGAVSLTLPKTRGADLAEFAARKGLTV